MSFIRRHADVPFFLYLSYNALHRPMEKPPQHYLDRFPDVADPRRQKLLAMLAAMDDGIRAVLDEIDAAGLGSSTLVVFLSDNGAPTEPNGSLNTPLRGGKEELSEGGIRVPFIVRWDGRIPAGLEYGDPVIQLDVLPTALAAAGIAAPVDREIDGVNLIPRLDGTGAGAPHAVLFWRYGEPSAVRRGDWKLLSPGTGPGGACRLAGAVAAPAALTASNPAD